METSASAIVWFFMGALFIYNPALIGEKAAKVVNDYNQELAK